MKKIESVQVVPLYAIGKTLQEKATSGLAVCTADFILWPPIEAGECIIEELESGRIPGGGCCICG